MGFLVFLVGMLVLVAILAIPAFLIALVMEFAGEKTHYFNGGMIARRRTVRM